jgi:CDP-6-deoxy-D-xylo-4-hexulose-3-dehydrase
MQAALGLTQLAKVELFIQKRKENYEYLKQHLSTVDGLSIAQATPNSDPSWFGFALTVRPNSPKTRNQIVQLLNEKKIGTRLLFGGNLLRQPAFIGTPRRVIDGLENTDRVMDDTFWIGVWPGISLQMLDYMIASLHETLGVKH